MRKALLIIALISGCFLMLISCEPLVNFFAFFPDTQDIAPADRLPDPVEEIFIETSDQVKLQAYLVRNPASDRMLIFFHGNAGNISHRLSDIMHLSNTGTNLLALSYRGYRKSQGRPSEKGIYLDGEVAFAYATETLGFPPQRIVVLGRSFGTTVAIHISQSWNIAGLILVTPLTCAKAHARRQGFGPLAVLAGKALDNLTKISNIKCPILVIHGTENRVIPYSKGKEVFDKAAAEKQLVTIKGAGHNNLTDIHPEKYLEAIEDSVRQTSVASLRAEG